MEPKDCFFWLVYRKYLAFVIITSLIFSIAPLTKIEGQECNLQKIDLEEKDGYYFDEGYWLNTFTKKPEIYYSLSKTLLIGTKDSFLYSSMAVITFGGLAALLGAKKDTWKVAAGVFTIYFPITTTVNLRSIKKKTIVRYQGNWKDPDQLGLYKYKEHWISKAEFCYLSWMGAKKLNTKEAYEEYLANFPIGDSSAVAREKLNQISSLRMGNKNSIKIQGPSKVLVIEKFFLNNEECDDSFLNLRIPRQVKNSLEIDKQNFFDRITISSQQGNYEDCFSDHIFVLKAELENFKYDKNTLDLLIDNKNPIKCNYSLYNLSTNKEILSGSASGKGNSVNGISQAIASAICSHILEQKEQITKN
ncbi:hypothetical protein JW998_02620 [candidate division KSB1 bacterium]|nr:hypothetical protein [candidate division KSB1 bacterium]